MKWAVSILEVILEGAEWMGAVSLFWPLEGSRVQSQKRLGETEMS